MLENGVRYDPLNDPLLRSSTTTLTGELLPPPATFFDTFGISSSHPTSSNVLSPPTTPVKLASESSKYFQIPFSSGLDPMRDEKLFSKESFQSNPNPINLQKESTTTTSTSKSQTFQSNQNQRNHETYHTSPITKFPSQKIEDFKSDEEKSSRDEEEHSRLSCRRDNPSSFEMSPASNGGMSDMSIHSEELSNNFDEPPTDFVLTEDRQKRFGCPYSGCDYKSNRKNNLQRHKETMHHARAVAFR